MADIYDLEIDLNADTSHSRTIRLTGRGKRVLEIGCATGYVAEILTEQFGCNVTGIEVNPEAAAKAGLRCHRVICADAETVDYANELDDERFDVVLCSDVLEHLKDPWAVLRKIRDLIEPDGYVVASIPNIGHAAVVLELLAGRFAYRPFGLLDNTHIRFFNRRSVFELFESTGYVVEELSRVEASPTATEFQIDLAAFPPEIVDFALRREEATTYQFIVKARPATAAGSLAGLRGQLEQIEASRDQESGRLAQDLEASRAALAAHEARAYQLCQRLETAEAQHATELAELRQRLETAQAQHDAATLELRRLETVHAEGEAEIFELTQRFETAKAQGDVTIASLHEHLGTARGLLAKREVAEAELRHDRDNARKLLAEREVEISGLRRELDETTIQLRRHLDTARSSLAEREAVVDGLRAELAAHQGVIQDIVNSWSWRLTEPTRRLKAVVRRVRKIGFARLLYWTLTLQLFTRLRALAIIERSGLFDESWYLSQYPDVARDGISPPLHYLRAGATEGRWPNPFFDTTGYLERYPDVGRTGQNPLVHYFRVGAAEGRDPSLRFDTSAYLDRYPDVAAAGINPLAHFLQRGKAEGRQADAITRSNHPKGLEGASTGSSDNATPIEDDYLDVSRRIADQRRHQLADLTFTPADMIHLRGRDVRAHAGSLSFDLPSAPEVSIVIRVDNDLALTLECLTSICLRTEDVRYEVIAINDVSNADARAVLSLISHLVYVEYEENLGFLSTCNAAAERARGQYLVFLSNDIQVNPGWLRVLLETFTTHDNVGAAGPKILSPDGRLQEAGALINPDGSTRFVGLGDDPERPRYNYPRQVDYCAGVCLMLRKNTLLQVGRLDDDPAAPSYEDVDLCLDLRARGLGIIYNPAAVVVRHLSAASSRVDSSQELACVTRNQQRIQETWLDRIEAINQVRVIAFYLPQFHPIPENDRWWGKGFTEWTKVTKAKPNFVGHYQPHLPSDLGFYDLRVEQVMEEQAALAQRYGIHGFCYYYYWFNGKRLLELPLERMLVTGKPDIPFCLIWANENWTRRWDGHEHEVLMGQNHSDEDDKAVIRDVIRYFRHPNYIRINGRPLFIVYRVDRFPDIRRTTGIWRAVCRTEGIGEVYLVNAETFQQSRDPESPSNHGCDAVVEFPPHGSPRRDIVPGELLNPNFVGQVSDYRDMLVRRMRRGIPGYVRFGTVMPSWDNTARQQDNPILFHSASPGAFQAWLEAVIDDTREQYCGEERIVFVNAWNEWAEGAHLEPDQRFGHGYLEAVQNALEHGLFRSVPGD